MIFIKLYSHILIHTKTNTVLFSLLILSPIRGFLIKSNLEFVVSNGAFAEDSWSIQRRSGEDDGSSNGLCFQGEGSSQRQRVRSRRRQSRLQVPYLVMVSSNFSTHLLDFSIMRKAVSFIEF